MFLWFSELFKRLVKTSPSDAVRELEMWPRDQRLFFLKLRLWAWSKRTLIESKTLVSELKCLPDDFLWEPDTRRELLTSATMG